MRVPLVDDRPLFLEGFYNLLTARGIDVVGTAGDGLEALEQARALRPDVILMDIQMPRCSGLEATRLIKAELPETKIVMLTVSAADENLFAASKVQVVMLLPEGGGSHDEAKPLRTLSAENVVIAEMAGTYRETAMKILNEFRAQGLIDLRRGCVVLVDEPGLRALSERVEGTPVLPT